MAPALVCLQRRCGVIHQHNTTHKKPLKYTASMNQRWLAVQPDLRSPRCLLEGEQPTEIGASLADDGGGDQRDAARGRCSDRGAVQRLVPCALPRGMTSSPALTSSPAAVATAVAVAAVAAHVAARSPTLCPRRRFTTLCAGA